MKLIINANIVNENKIFKGSIFIEKDLIKEIYEKEVPKDILEKCEIIDAKNKYVLPGVIDDQVHFREPGLTHKANIYTESRAAVAGGITSYMEMPNTVPQAITQELLEAKYKIASEKSFANYSFYMGATNANIDEIVKTNPKNICGLKVFMGSSTGNMLVDNKETLKNIFTNSPVLIATHNEDEEIIQKNIASYKVKYGDKTPISAHAFIRSEEACYKSSSIAVELAEKYKARLHILHLSTAKELSLFTNKIPSKDKKITAEVCVHHLWFSYDDYKKYGTKIKWNPAIKTKNDRDKLLEAVINNKIDVIATDHAPHLLVEKEGSYFKAMSGGPLVQHSLAIMLELFHQNKISLQKVVEKMCHIPADIFQVAKRGYIRKNYKADLIIVDTNTEWEVSKNNILYKCGWSPFEGQKLKSKVRTTIINGTVVYDDGIFNEDFRGERLIFER